MRIPNQDIGIVDLSYIYEEDPLAIVANPSTPATNNNELVAQQANQELDARVLEESRLAGNDPFTVNTELAEQIRQDRQQTDLTQAPIFGVGEDKFQDERQNRGFIQTALGENVRASDQGRLTALLDAGTASALRAEGFQPVYQKDYYSGYRYNPETGAYDYYDNTPSFLETALPAAMKGVFLSMVTAGLGGAVAGSLGFSSGAGLAGSAAASNALGVGLTNAATSAAIQKFLFDDVDTQTALLAGFKGGLESYAASTAVAVDNAKHLENLANTGNAGERAIAATQVADAVKIADDMTAVNTVLQNTMTAYEAVDAIENENYLVGFNKALSLTGSPTLQEWTSDKIKGFSDNYLITSNSDAIASAALGAAESIARGGDTGEIMQNAFNTLVDDIIFNEDRIENYLSDLNNPIINDNLEAFTKAIDTATRKALDGDNSKEIFLSTSRDFLLNANVDVSESELAKVLSDAWASTLQTRRMIESTVGYSINYLNDTLVQPALKAGENILRPAYNALRYAEEQGEEAWQSVFGSEGSGEGIEFPSPTETPDIETYGEVQDVAYRYDPSDIIQNPLLARRDSRIESLTDSLALDNSPISLGVEEDEENAPVTRIKPQYVIGARLA